ncbi:hypothetical protein MANY_44720 [Mycolicibacterium anyangense]|uniref:Uncharacterized protein n=1 Tax=Mycolicibacterium anyangense TaxID=1431246 RepID=A0A6N4WEA6_9MYCO|nr:hypothetical protein [Mycolicibacterium anyangense]BBZ79135.1 hypothetical protein MANY_44720 [Mycolicibacterium anyangense]
MDGAGEILRTVGLLLNLTAIIGFAVFMSSLAHAGSGPSGAAAGITIGAFIASLLCFAADDPGDENVLSEPATPTGAISRSV